MGRVSALRASDVHRAQRRRRPQGFAANGLVIGSGKGYQLKIYPSREQFANGLRVYGIEQGEYTGRICQAAQCPADPSTMLAPSTLSASTSGQARTTTSCCSTCTSRTKPHAVRFRHPQRQARRASAGHARQAGCADRRRSRDRLGGRGGPQGARRSEPPRPALWHRDARSGADSPTRAGVGACCAGAPPRWDEADE